MPIFPLTIPEAIAAAERVHHRDPIKRLLADQCIEVSRHESRLIIAFELKCGHPASLEVDSYTVEDVIAGLPGVEFFDGCKCISVQDLTTQILNRRPS